MGQEREIDESSPTRLEADVVARKSFDTVRRGFDQAAVRTFLRSVADEIRAARHRETELRVAIRDADARARRAEARLAAEQVAPPPIIEPTPSPPSEPQSEAQLVGDRTARVLEAAEAAAAEIAGRAEDERARLVAEAHAAADELVAEAQATADELIADARQLADDELSAAREAGQSLVDEARAFRRQLLADLGRRHHQAREQLEQLWAGRALVEEAFAHARQVLDPALDGLGALDERVREVAAAAVEKAGQALTVDQLDAALAELTASGQLSVHAAEAVEDTSTEAEDRNLDATNEPADEGAVLAETDTEVAEIAEIAEITEAEGEAPDLAVIAEDASERDVVELPVAPAPREGRHSSSVTVVRAHSGEREPTPAAEEVVAEEVVAEEVVAEEVVAEEVVAEEVVAEEVAAEEVAAEAAPASFEEETEEVVASLFARIRADHQTLAAAPPLTVRGGDSPDVARKAPKGESSDGRVETPAAEPTGDEPELVDARARALSGPERGLSRTLKRVLADEQNELLDAIRRSKGVPAFEDALPDAESHTMRYAAAARSELRDAAYAGAHFLEPAPADAERPTVDDLAAHLGVEVVGPLRKRLTACWDESGDNEVELIELVRGTYRQWRNKVLPEASRRSVAEAFNRGIRAIHDERAERWLVEIS